MYFILAGAADTDDSEQQQPDGVQLGVAALDRFHPAHKEHSP